MNILLVLWKQDITVLKHQQNVNVLFVKKLVLDVQKCGHPYIEYHHIIPFSEEGHFRTEDMVALCGNCHPAVSKLGRDLQYEIKNKPHNIRKNILNGALEYDKRDLVFKVGGNWFENTPVILQFQSTPIISCTLKEGQAKVSLNLFDEFGSLIFSVAENDVAFRINDVWDFEYAHNFAIARYGPGDIAVRMDFRKEEAVIEGNLWIGNRKVRLGPNDTTLPGGYLKGNRMSNCGVGIQIGAHSK
jgi:hypothetical protein